MKRLAGQPFALIGINADANKKLIAEQKKKQKVNWRSFWNGPKGFNGPIIKDWRIRFVPEVYVIDAKGVIRFKGVSGKALDKAVDSLLAELKKPAHVATF